MGHKAIRAGVSGSVFFIRTFLGLAQIMDDYKDQLSLGIE